MGVVARSVTALAIGAALTVGGASLASAGSWGHGGKWDGGNLASGKVSAFDYANGGTGGYVTAFSPTSITIDEWNGTTATFTLSGTTTYSVGTTSATYSALADGERVMIGVSSAGSTAASSVTIELAMLFGTVTSVSGNSINIRDFQGFTRNIIVGGTGGTTYTMDGSPSSLSAVIVGARILAQGTIDANGTSLDALTVEIGSAAGSMGFTYGTVTGVTSSTLTVLAKDGTSTTFIYTTTTIVKALGDPSATLTTTDLALNEHVGVAFDTSAATTAVTIDIKLAHVSGTVSAVSGDNITVQDHQGFTRMILVGTTTTYTQNGTTSTTDPVTVGMRIRAEGVVDANGSTLDALTITICSTTKTGGPTPQFPGSHHHGGWGGNGGGNGGGGIGGGFQVSANYRSHNRH
jgi:hypothetical protein